MSRCDCYTSARGHTRTLGNYVRASFKALCATYGFLDPTLWEKNQLRPSPFQEHTDHLKDNHKNKVAVAKAADN